MILCYISFIDEFHRNFVDGYPHTDMHISEHWFSVISHFDAVRYFIQVKEHLEIFAILKGVQEDFLNSVVIDMVDQVSSFCITGFLHVLFTLYFLSIISSSKKLQGAIH